MGVRESERGRKRERESEREMEREKDGDERETSIGCLPFAPQRGMEPIT